jgi:hypothetical protein
MCLQNFTIGFSPGSRDLGLARPWAGAFIIGWFQGGFWQRSLNL